MVSRACNRELPSFPCSLESSANLGFVAFQPDADAPALHACIAHVGVNEEVYTFGAPAVSRPAMPDKTQPDGHLHTSLRSELLAAAV